jgi:arsenite oxidase small subunit
MKSGPKMVDVGRRKFPSGAGLAAAGAAASAALPSAANAATGQARVEYPSNRLANVRDLKSDEAHAVPYPDPDASAVRLEPLARFDFGLECNPKAGPQQIVRIRILQSDYYCLRLRLKVITAP